MCFTGIIFNEGLTHGLILIPEELQTKKGLIHISSRGRSPDVVFLQGHHAV